MGTLGVGKDERRDMVSIRYEKNEGVLGIETDVTWPSLRFSSPLSSST